MKKKNRSSIFVSPDGGETVYEQLPNGDRILVEQSQSAKDEEQAYEEAEMVNAEAIALRRKYPTLQKAWDKYRTVWHLINGNQWYEPLFQDHFYQQCADVCVRLKGHYMDRLMLKYEEKEETKKEQMATQKRKTGKQIQSVWSQDS